MRAPQVAAATVVVVLVLSWSAPTAAQRVAPLGVPPEQRKITVDGEARLEIEPNRARIAFGIESSHSELKKARQINEHAVLELLAALEGHGVEARHVSTDFLDIEPRYDPTRPRQFVGYFVRKTLVVELTTIDGFEAVLGAGLEAGATHVLGIEFSSTDIERHRARVSSAAIVNARQKAEVLAAQLDQEVGRPVSITETGGAAVPGFRRGWTSEEPALPAPGKISIQASVRVTFELL